VVEVAAEVGAEVVVGAAEEVMAKVGQHLRCHHRHRRRKPSTAQS